ALSTAEYVKGDIYSLAISILYCLFGRDEMSVSKIKEELLFNGAPYFYGVLYDILVKNDKSINLKDIPTVSSLVSRMNDSSIMTNKDMIDIILFNIEYLSQDPLVKIRDAI